MPLHAISDKRMEQQLEEVLILHALSSKLPAQQYDLMRLRLAGYSVREIAAEKKLSEKKVRTLLRKTRESYARLCESP